MKQRFYIDTSVIGGVFDEEFEEYSTIFFEKVKLGQITSVYSEFMEEELARAPKRVKDFFYTLPKQFLERVSISKEAIELAETYIKEKVVGQTSIGDCSPAEIIGNENED